jgi:DNA polymerase III delta prime subunit
MDPQLVVAALVARVLDVAALFAILAFYMIISRKTAEKKQAESESEPKPTEPEPTEPEQKPKKKKLESESEPKPAESEPKPKPTDPDWEWPIYDECYSRKTHSYERKLRGEEENEKNKNKDNPFEVTYRKQKEWPDEVFVTLISSYLIEVITQCLPKNKEMTDTTPKLSGRDLFLAMHTIRNYKIIEEQSETAKVATPKKQLEESEIATASAKKVKESENSAAAAKKLAEHEDSSKPENSSIEEPEISATAAAKIHVGHLLRFLEKEYKDTRNRYERMKQDGTASWAMLWAFLPPGEKVYYHCQFSGQELCGIVRLRHYSQSPCGKVLRVELNVMDYDGKSYRACNVSRQILEFQEERSFNSLSVCPLRFAKQREQMEAAFLANGKRFYELSVKPNSFVHFKGPLIRLEFIPGTKSQHLVKHKADGRVMIDLRSFARMNPGYDMGNATPPTAYDLVCGLQDSDNLPDDESLQLAPALVYGFAFSTKHWGCFPVTGFSKISFDDQAFDRHLVMSDEDQKKMLLGLVSQYVHDRKAENGKDNNTAGVVAPSIDPISNKGEGCIFLCYGPPGTGKTLTAESVAEKLHRPLWAVSASELSFEVDKLEQKLVEILDIASSWHAVLLLDEADIYLEKRNSAGDPKRNAMTGIFLRLLEYYKGVLFLTTNRVTTFDDAFCSRISMFIRYHRLTHSQRAKVWENLLSRVDLMDVDLDMFAAHELNGREIRNSIRTAQTWATNCKQPLTTQHVLSVVKMLENFREDLQDAVLEESQIDNPFSSVLATLQQQQSTILSNNNTYSNGDMGSKP